MIRRKTFILSFGWGNFSSRSKSWERELFYSRHRTNKNRSRSWEQNKLYSTRQWWWLEELLLRIVLLGRYQCFGVLLGTTARLKAGRYQCFGVLLGTTARLKAIFSVVLGRQKECGQIEELLLRIVLLGRYHLFAVMGIVGAFSVVLGKQKEPGLVMIRRICCAKSLSWTLRSYLSRNRAHAFRSSFSIFETQRKRGTCDRVSLSWSRNVWESKSWLEKQLPLILYLGLRWIIVLVPGIILLYDGIQQFGKAFIGHLINKVAEEQVHDKKNIFCPFILASGSFSELFLGTWTFVFFHGWIKFLLLL